MVQITNVKVYDLEECVIASRNAMRITPPEYTKEEFEKSLVRAKKLVQASAKDKHVKCHDNFLTGIRVSFDIKYPQYFTPELQRYHFIDIIASSSKMHKLMAMRIDECCNEYVDKERVEATQRDCDLYNHIVECHIEKMEFGLRNGEVRVATTYDDCLYYARMIALSNCPLGLELFMRVSTNYKQLQTIYWQRKNHRLREDWGNYENFIKSLPYSADFITGEYAEQV